MPNDTLLRAAPSYSLLAGGGERREGVVYGYDRRNARLIAIGKGDGHYIAQYRLAGDADGWEDMRGFYVLPGIEEGPPTVFWISSTALHQALLEPVSEDGEASPSSSPGANSGASSKPSTEPTAAH